MDFLQQQQDSKLQLKAKNTYKKADLFSNSKCRKRSVKFGIPGALANMIIIAKTPSWRVDVSACAIICR